MKSLEEIKPGLTLGRYECLLPIARGGMAAVWAARVQGARGFEKMVAVKTMLPMLSDDPNFERMFLDEARIASRVRHPNVVEILDLGEQDNLLYLVMEWVDGAPLSVIMREAFRQGGMPAPIAIRIMQDVCSGLHAAHELTGDDRTSLQLVHRDVSPQNIMVAETGVVKLVDFGVAKVLGRCAGETDTGMIRGKLAYLAPEQIVARPLDRRTDLFAVGVILYQLTTGKHPFRGDNAGATMNNILRRNVPPPSKISTVPLPAALDSVILRALDRELEFRFQTAAELNKALDAVSTGANRATTEDVAAYVRPIIGPSGDEFRRALKRVSRSAAPSGADMANALASSAMPVDGTPASGEWMMRSSAVSLHPKASESPAGSASGGAVVHPALPLPESGDPAAAEPTADGAPAGDLVPARPSSPSGALPVATESTMSGAETDSHALAAAPSRRRALGLAVFAGVLVVSLGTLMLTRFVGGHRPGPRTLEPGTGVSAALVAARPPPSASEEPLHDAAVRDAEREAQAADAAPPAVASHQVPAASVLTPSGKGPGKLLPFAATAGGGVWEPPSSQAPTKRWTPPVSDPGF